jgi:hypothetical protein
MPGFRDKKFGVSVCKHFLLLSSHFDIDRAVKE